MIKRLLTFIFSFVLIANINALKLDKSSHTGNTEAPKDVELIVELIKNGIDFAEKLEKKGFSKNQIIEEVGAVVKQSVAAQSGLTTMELKADNVAYFVLGAVTVVSGYFLVTKAIMPAYKYIKSVR